MKATSESDSVHYESDSVHYVNFSVLTDLSLLAIHSGPVPERVGAQYDQKKKKVQCNRIGLCFQSSWHCLNCYVVGEQLGVLLERDCAESCQVHA